MIQFNLRYNPPTNYGEMSYMCQGWLRSIFSSDLLDPMNTTAHLAQDFRTIRSEACLLRTPPRLNEEDR